MDIRRSKKIRKVLRRERSDQGDYSFIKKAYEEAYRKGSFVVALLREAVGAQVWDERIPEYLLHHSHATTNINDLVKFVQNMTQEFSAKEFLTSWTTQKSGPLVSIVRRADEDGGRQLERNCTR